MRVAVALVLLSACEPAFQPRPLPPLIAPRAPEAITGPVMLVAGEQLIYEVSAQGFAIARVELDVRDGEAVSRFRTNRLASTFANVSHDLTTRFHASRPLESVDDLVLDGAHTVTTTRFAGSRVQIASRALAVPGGNLGHTLHTALGAIRAWASPQASRGYLYIVHAGEVYKLDLGEPIAEGGTLRIEGRLRVPDEVGLTIWLREGDRVPVRFEIRAAGTTLAVALVAA